MKNNQRFNTITAGLIPGLVLPVVTFLLIGLIANHGDLINFIRRLEQVDRVASIISLSVIPNLLLFFIFIWTNRLVPARGVLLSTFIFALVMLIVKFL